MPFLAFFLATVVFCQGGFTTAWSRSYGDFITGGKYTWKVALGLMVGVGVGVSVSVGVSEVSTVGVLVLVAVGVFVGKGVDKSITVIVPCIEVWIAQ